MTSQTKGCAIEFVDVQYTVTYPDPQKSKMFDKVMTTKTIIKGVTGKIEPGQALAIMGASGAGKTTLLNILAGRINGEGLQGEVRFDGKALKPKEISSIVGFVMQNDIFIEFLTVEETLQFAGKLKFKGDEKERKDRINALVGQLKLENARNTLVGGQFAKGISGGEKKRLNIAFELISDPPVIFMDEPTSGLDSYTSFLVVKLMGDIARQVQKTVIYTIHQPSSEIFQMFDQLLLIYKGKLIFQGNAKDSVPYFKDELQLPCDVNSNPSDHFMYMMQVTNPLVENKMIQTYEKKIAPAIAAKINPPNSNEVKFDLRDFSPLLNQFGALFSRSVLATKRNPLLTFVKIAQNLIMGFIFCSIFFQLTTNPPGTNDTQNLFNKNGSLFFMTAFHFIPAMMAVIVSFPVQRLVFLKEYSGRFYSSFPYFMSKLTIELPLSIIFPILWTCAIYYITDYHNPFVNLCKMALTAALMNVCANCLGLAIGAGFNDIDTALNVTPLIFFPLMLFCGFYANSDSIPNWVSWIEYISPFRYGLEALITNEFGGRGFNPDPVATLGYSLGYWNAILLMVALTVAYMLLAYIILATRARTLNN